jgi:hypothetical protein
LSVAATQEQRWDRERDYRKHEERPQDRQRLAVAALVGECEAIVGSGVLTEPAERSLRLLIANVLQAHGMLSIAERGPA